MLSAKQVERVIELFERFVEAIEGIAEAAEAEIIEGDHTFVPDPDGREH